VTFTPPMNFSSYKDRPRLLRPADRTKRCVGQPSRKLLVSAGLAATQVLVWVHCLVGDPGVDTGQVAEHLNAFLSSTLPTLAVMAIRRQPLTG
jgi:hypothetical protein